MLTVSLPYLFPLSPVGGKKGGIGDAVPLERCFSWAPL